MSLPDVSRRSFLTSLAAASLLRAQDDAKFSMDVKVVSVLTTVHDKQGKIVSNLTKDDFELSEDGRPQVIKYFSRETNLPLTLGLLVDTSLSQRQVLGEEKTASYRFLEQVLREDKDQAFLIHFDRDVELLQDLTSSRTKLEKALDELELPQQDRPQLSRRGGGGGYPGGSSRRMGGPGTTLYDAIYLASDDDSLMKKQQGRKALILLTDGVDNGSKEPLSAAIEKAQRADALVYSILFAGQEGYQQPFGGFGGRGMGRRGGRFPQAQQRPDGKKVLQQISRETGAGFFEVSKKMPIDQIYGRIQEELRNQYDLGYTSDGNDSSGVYRKIAVNVKEKNLIAQAREGYYPSR